jgi:microcystin-dependent protein
MADPYLAQISIVAFNFPPRGWAFCNGQLLQISQNQALFSILGTTYGGDGRTTFALPNFQGMAPLHVGSGFALGNTGGEPTHTLLISEMPSHTHTPSGSPSTANARTTTGNSWAAESANPYSPTSSGSMQPGCIGISGGSQPHNNLQPYLVLNFVIALVGIFPSRN